MVTLIVSSTEDPASTNMKKYLLIDYNWSEIEEMFGHAVYSSDDLNSIIVTIDDRHIRHEEIDKEVEDHLGIKIHQMVTVSRHRSKTGEPTLSTHPLGNFGEAKFGGRDRTFVKSSPKLMTTLLRLIKKHATARNLYHQVTFEATHHGPYVHVPAFYAEVGSNENEWRNDLPAKVVADSILELLSSYGSERDLPGDIPVLVGIGGGHYVPRFTDLVFKKNVAFGHMIPNYQIDTGLIDMGILQKVFDATPGFSGVYIHRKSLKKSVTREFERMFRDMDVRVWRSADLDPLP